MTTDKQKEIEAELSKTMGYKLFNGWHNYRSEHLLGYHSFSIEDVNIKGQRDPLTRIEIFKNHVDFVNKSVIDFGCNVGAMLHHLPEISKGIGIDYDQKCISAAINISKILNRENLDFKFMNLTPPSDIEGWKNSLDRIVPFKPDVVFLLSLGSWIKWKSLYEFCTDLNCEIILETNNDREGQDQLSLFASAKKDIQKISDNSLDDITGNHGRKTYLIR